MPDPDRLRPAPAKPGKASHRTAVFREIGREIVHKDRFDRKAGLSVDIAGAIAHALERAYAQGFRDAQAHPPPAEVGAGGADAGEPVEWVLIPPRPRVAFWAMCLYIFGRDASAAPDETGHLHPTATPRGRPAWRLVTRIGRDDKPFGQATILPLVRLGLLDPVHEPDRRLVVSELGRATWWSFLERGGRYGVPVAGEPEVRFSASEHPDGTSMGPHPTRAGLRSTGADDSGSRRTNNGLFRPPRFARHLGHRSGRVRP